jgi:hypothetical protein
MATAVQVLLDIAGNSAGALKALAEIDAALTVAETKAKTAATKAAADNLINLNGGVAAARQALADTAKAVASSVTWYPPSNPALIQSAEKDGEKAATGFVGKFQSVIGTGISAVAGAIGGVLSDGFKKTSESAGELNEKAHGLSETFTKLGEAGLKVAAGQGSILGFLGSLGSSIPMIGGVVAGLGLLGGLLEHVVTEQADYAFAIEEQNQLLGINTTLLQTLDAMVARVGLDHDNLTKVLQRFSANIAQGGPSLKVYGLNLADLGVTTKDLNVAIPELIKWMSSQTDKTYANAVATALMGKGATGLIASFDKGLPAFKAFTDEMQRNGQLMSDSEIKAGALAKIFKDDMMASFQGVVRQLSGPLFTGMSQLFHAITLGAQGGQGAFHNLGTEISKVLTQVVGFVVSLVGGKAGIDAFNKSLGDSSAAYNSDAAATASAAAVTAQKKVTDLEAKISLDALTESTADQTKALDASIKTLNDRQTAFDAVIAKEITGYTDASTAFTKRTDKEISDLNNASVAYAKNADEQIQSQHDIVTAMDQRMAMEQAQQQLADDNGTSALAILKAQLAATQTTYSDQRQAGESVNAYLLRIRQEGLQDQITTEEQKRALAKDTAAIDKQTATDAADAVIRQLNDQKLAYADETKVRVDTLTVQKQAYADDTAARIASLNTQKTAYDDDTKARIASLDAQKVALQDNLSAAQRSYNDLTNTMQDQLAAAQSDLSQAQAGFNAVVQGSADSLIGNLALTFSDPGSYLQRWIDWLGDTLGRAFIGGLGHGLETAARNLASPGTWLGWLKDVAPRLLSPGTALVGLAGGGPTNPGQPYIVGEHGPELRVFSQPGSIVPLTKGGLVAHASGSAAAGTTIHQNVYITGSSAEMQDVARREIDLANTQLIQRITATVA